MIMAMIITNREDLGMNKELDINKCTHTIGFLEEPSMHYEQLITVGSVYADNYFNTNNGNPYIKFNFCPDCGKKNK
jgi:hypothetical protein